MILAADTCQNVLHHVIRTQSQPQQQQSVNGRGRPRLGSFRLETMLPRAVLLELERVECETGVYRTRIAANVLCEWAKSSARNRVC